MSCSYSYVKIRTYKHIVHSMYKTKKRKNVSNTEWWNHQILIYKFFIVNFIHTNIMACITWFCNTKMQKKTYHHRKYLILVSRPLVHCLYPVYTFASSFKKLDGQIFLLRVVVARKIEILWCQQNKQDIKRQVLKKGAINV